jgi:uncharacterized protein
MAMFKRELTNELLEAAKSYPVVTLLGPRQSGKTTLVQIVFASKPYINLEVPDIRAAATSDPNAFLAKYPTGVILDEIQRAPILLSYIQDIVDRKNIKGMFVLTGSHQLELNQAISQSLAGRSAILKLLPLTISELQTDESLDDYLYKGFFPRIYNDHLDPT